MVMEGKGINMKTWTLYRHTHTHTHTHTNVHTHTLLLTQLDKHTLTHRNPHTPYTDIHNPGSHFLIPSQKVCTLSPSHIHARTHTQAVSLSHTH